ncbi:xylanase [Micromonospora parathelypteridis]|nr:xylanase [Micromonospora parathelypteridis]
MVAAATALATVAGVLTAPPPLLAATPDITVNTASSYQTIDGFGAATPIFNGSGSPWTDSETQTLVGMGQGQLGMSIVRTVVSPVSSEWSLYANSLKMAKSYGSDVKILASPWTAPAAFKTNNSRINGGKLRTDYYDDYAEHLNSYVQYMKGQGVPIDVTSVQNEPDWHPDYDSMDWTGTELRNFVRDQGTRIRDTRLMVGESLRFNRAYTDPTLQDATARNNVGYVGGHLYDAENSGNLSSYPLANQYGKNQWMTEWNLHAADGNGSNIWGNPSNAAVWNETLDNIMRTVHRSMEASWSAYIWWYGRRFYSFIGDGDSQYGTTKGAVLRRGQAFSQYSKYVRPGDKRVALSKSSKTSSLEVTAYQGRGKVTLVILNRSNSAVDSAVVQTPQSISNAEYTVTSQGLGAAAQPVSLGDGQATINIPARSISTLTVSEGAAPTDPPTTPPAGDSCSASVTQGTVWGDRYNTSVTVSGASNWTAVVSITSPQRVSTTWGGGSFTWDSSGTVATVRSNGSGNTFGFTTMMNGNSGARPQIRSCTAS